MSINLRDYQIAAINKMSNGCILNGGVGSGKSRTALAYYFFRNGGKEYTDPKTKEEKYVPMQNPKDLYIITTAAKRDKKEWDLELIPFLMSSDKNENIYDNKVIIDSWNNVKKYTSVTNAFFIFDEQRVVGSGSWVKSFIQISKANEWILLTATPGDRWLDYIPVFIANGFYKNRSQFLREHVIFKNFRNYPVVDRYINERKLMFLRDKILVKMDYSSPSTATHKYITVPYDKNTYMDIIKYRKDPFTGEPIENQTKFIYLLRKVVNMNPERLTMIKDLLKTHKRIIVFYNFDYELDLLKTIPVPIGEWNSHNHDQVPNTDKWLYLVQYNAGSEGWQCTDTNAMLFYSPTYSYKTMIQAAGRIDRSTNKFHDLYYYHFVSPSTIDKAITKALSEKKNFNEKDFDFRSTR